MAFFITVEFNKKNYTFEEKTKRSQCKKKTKVDSEFRIEILICVKHETEDAFVYLMILISRYQVFSKYRNKLESDLSVSSWFPPE